MNQVKLAVNGVDLVFEPNYTAYNQFINEMSMDNKVAPANNYLRRIASQDTKEALDTILVLPGAALQLVEEVNKIFAPKLEIEVKN
ncbi:hypothetical protein FEM41_01920 [Jejubacter calystegiae]|uniref:Phage protein n=1 Tax=Jejubacter calystegiae TaxID=2579935 RepID=A0A4P8YNW2_9ENTR|nr:putative phage tail assembly chaperone [Jejubacter calystegiae]QCT22581.1 hypothetical protein FEM41_01920 [Jejubacter calystegiae]